MPPTVLPPMTSRQAKRLAKKSKAQFEYTASQMRRADRREELDKRKKHEDEKEERKVFNKRKRDEQEEKERRVKQKLYEEGKIGIEDTWGKINASQPRLNNFFKAPLKPVRTSSAPLGLRKPRTKNIGEDVSLADAKPAIDGDGEDKENEPASQSICGSQEDTLVNEQAIIEHAIQTDLGEEISETDLLKVFSSQPHLTQTPPSPPRTDSNRQHTSSNSAGKRTSTTASRSKHTASTIMLSPSILKRGRSPTPEATPSEDAFPDAEVGLDLEIAEDDTAADMPENDDILAELAESPSSPAKSFRSVLSEMSVANVNTRAQEKPDITSAKTDSGLPTPSRPRALVENDWMDGVHDGDFVDDELIWDKENSDPLSTPEKEQAKSTAASQSKSKPGTPILGQADASPSSSTRKKLPQPGFSKSDNFEDIYDFDFSTNSDDEEDFDDQLDDAALLTLSTQKPRADKIIAPTGSPRKLTPNKDAVVRPLPLHLTPRRSMPPPPPKSKLLTPSKLRKETYNANTGIERSLSFASIGDDDMLEAAEQVEEELSQRSQKGKEKMTSVGEITFKQPALPTALPKLRKRRTLPWEHVSAPPASTQDLLMKMADEVDDVLDI